MRLKIDVQVQQSFDLAKQFEQVMDGFRGYTKAMSLNLELLSKGMDLDGAHGLGMVKIVRGETDLYFKHSGSEGAEEDCPENTAIDYRNDLSGR